MSNRNQLAPYINPPINRIIDIQNIVSVSDNNNTKNEDNINSLHIVNMRASYVEPFPRYLCTVNGNNGVAVSNNRVVVARCAARHSGVYTKIRWIQLLSGTITLISGVVYNELGELITYTEDQSSLQGSNVIITATLLSPVIVNKGDILYNGIAYNASPIAAFAGISLKNVNFQLAGIYPAGGGRASSTLTSPRFSSI